MRRGARTFRAYLRSPVSGRLDYLLRLVEEDGSAQTRDSGPALEIRVRGPDGGPVRGGLVRFYGGSGGRPALQGQRGVYETVRFRFDRAGLTRWWLEVVGARSGARPLASKLVELSSPTGQVEVRLEAAREIAGRVVDEEGQPVLGVPIEAYSADPRHPVPDQARHGEGVSEEGGAFVVRGLDGGSYRLRAKAPEGFADPDPVEAAGGARDVAITLSREAPVVVTLLDAKGGPVGKQAVLVRPEGGGRPVINPYLCETSGEGRVRLRGLDRAKRYRLEVWPGRSRPDLLPHRIEPWAPADTVIRLKRAYILAGTVRDRAGEPTRARVYRRGTGEEEWTWEWTREGRFRFEGLAFGEYELKALPPRGARPEDPAFPLVRATAGEEGIELRLP
jgi:hypothetical protein